LSSAVAGREAILISMLFGPTARWKTELYDRTLASGFTNSAGAEPTAGWRGCIDALFGIYASCPSQGKLTLEVVPASSKRHMLRPIRGETPLFALAADIRALLATTSRLDGVVRLRWLGAGDVHLTGEAGGSDRS
jgi:hypothetical protein